MPGGRSGSDSCYTTTVSKVLMLSQPMRLGIPEGLSDRTCSCGGWGVGELVQMCLNWQLAALPGLPMLALPGHAQFDSLEDPSSRKYSLPRDFFSQ